MTLSDHMTCCCGNTARYINERYEYCCSLCPIGEGLDSIRLSDVKALHTWCVTYLNEHPKPKAYREELERIVDNPPTMRRALDELAWARKYLADHQGAAPHRHELRSLIGRVPVMPLFERIRLEGAPFVFQPNAPLVITNVEQLINDQTYKTYTPTAADGDIIGEPLASRLEPKP